MAPSELFRFRTVRPIQNKQTGFGALTVTPSGQQPTQDQQQQWNANLVTFLGAYSWLRTLSGQLAAASDEVAPSAVIALLPSTWTSQVTAWAPLTQSLTDILAWLMQQVSGAQADAGNYGIPVIPASLTQSVELAVRLLLVQDLVSTLANDQSLPTTQRQLQSSADVQQALAFRTVALPPNLFNSAPPVLARAPGVTDLSVVTDEWNRYIPDELANVVNVLPGETFDSTVRHMEETVQAQSTTTTQSTTQTTENSQTTTDTLSTTATNDASLNIGAHAQIETSGQYGPTQVKTNVGGQVQSSQSSSQSSAHTTAVETVSRAVKTVSQTVVQAQSTSTTVKDTTHEEHKLDNQGATVVVGLYRWLSEVHRVELVNYPNRFIVEFEIPEPGIWLNWALTNQPAPPYDNPNPGVFALNNVNNVLDPADPNQPDPNPTPLQPAMITSQIASALASRWRVQGITSPPDAQITVGNSYTVKPDNTGSLVLNDSSITVPTGYVGVTADIQFAAAGGDDQTHATEFYAMVGDIQENWSVPATSTATAFAANATKLNFQSATYTGVIPVSFWGFYVIAYGLSLNVTVVCQQANLDGNGNGDPYRGWQQTTFNQIAQAYDTLLTAYNQERDERLQTQTGPQIVGPPALNLSRAVAELKRLAIQNLLGQPFSGYDLITPQPLGTNEPTLSPQSEVAPSPVIQFFEQAFEWENIVYICYPYFWGGHERWAQNATWSSPDPIFDQFLAAGSVRLVVPARPGFEDAVNFFLYTSAVWSGKNPPGPNDPGYLSVADEVQAVQVGATDGTPLAPSWEVTLPTTLLWAGSDPTTLPVNPYATIPPPPPPTSGLAAVNMTAVSSGGAAVFGQPITFTVTVVPTTGSGTPTGQITFAIDGQAVAGGAATLDDTGKATSPPVTALAVGTHTVVATYAGDSTFAPATELLTQTVAQATSTTAVASSANPATRSSPVAFTVTVTASPPGGGTPTGQASVQVDGQATPDSPLTLDPTGQVTSAGVTTLTTGTHDVTAQYLGDANFAPSTSATLTQTVTRRGGGGGG